MGLSFWLFRPLGCWSIEKNQCIFLDWLARNWEIHLKTLMEQMKPLVTEKNEFQYQLKSFFFVSFELSHYPLFHSRYKLKKIITVFSSTGKQFILFLTANFLSKESDEQVFMNCLPLVKCWSKRLYGKNQTYRYGALWNQTTRQTFKFCIYGFFDCKLLIQGSKKVFFQETSHCRLRCWWRKTSL